MIVDRELPFNLNLPSVPESIVSLHVLQGYDHTSPINYRKQVILGLRGRVEPVVLAPRESRSIFSTSRSISADGTTAWTLTLSSSSRSRYRFTHSSGTAPALRTDRSLTHQSKSYTPASCKSYKLNQLTSHS
jgi:hypothetical protein